MPNGVSGLPKILDFASSFFVLWCMLRLLDKKRFLGVDFWEFGIRSMNRRLGIEIVGNLLFSHPIKSIKGFLKYGHYLAQNKPRKRLSVETIPHLRPLLIGAYCQKPKDCPSGRFNHRCLFAETLITYSSCEPCDLKKMAELAAILKCPFYIMTTALEVLVDIFLSNTFSHFLVMICTYAKGLFLFPAFIFNMEGWAFTLGRGSCRNYQEFLLADMGGKCGQTFPSPLAYKSFIDLYNQIKMAYRDPKVGSNDYQALIKKGHFYIP